MDVEDLVSRHPMVFHTLSASAWPSVQELGLLSTVRLADHFALGAAARHELLSSPRARSTLLEAAGRPPALVRDQKPMKFIAEKIEAGSSLAEYLHAINSRVFFWASPERLKRLSQAREYRTEAQVILHVSTRALVERYEPKIRLCRFNSGAVTQKNHPARGHRSWIPIAQYPYHDYRRRHGVHGALVEVTVLDAVPDILDITDRVEHRSGPTLSNT